MHWGVLAHSTHLRGAGTYDHEHGERCRVDVTLVTGIPREKVLGANLGYLAPEDFDLAAYEARPGDLRRPQRRRGAVPAALTGPVSPATLPAGRPAEPPAARRRPPDEPPSRARRRPSGRAADRRARTVHA